MKSKTTILLLTLLMSALGTAAKDYTITSPDGQLTITVHANAERLTWELSHGQTAVLAPSEIGINGALPNMKPTRQRNLFTNGKYSVEFRADNDAAAYRIIIAGKKPVTVSNETAEFNFADDYTTYVPYVNDNRGGERYCFSFESYYEEQKLSSMYDDSLAINPLSVRLPCSKLAVIADMGATDYPGMFLQKNGRHGLKADFAPYPLSEEIGGYNRLNLVPTKRADYIARNVRGPLPWRIVMVTTNDAQLLAADLPRRFGPLCQLKDTSWIRPGKVAWDWWNATMLTGVPFRAGMNTDTYRYYIDFAAHNGIEYIIIDEGWSTDESLRSELNPDIDLLSLLPYAKQKGVGIILWTSWRNCINNTEDDFRYYATLGVKGFKVDFFDRDDQLVMQSAWRIADCAARNHLLLDLHGYRPTGIQTAYPNIVNFEGVKGLENSKWEPRVGDGPLHNQPRYDVTAPYLRQLVGPMDYTPGSMSNATRAQFFGNNDHPMSQGTRAHQVAMYVAFDAPLQMLADAPTKYEREQPTTDFIRQIPTTWDEIRPISGKLGEWLAVAKRKGTTWYLCAMTDWQPRTLTLPLSMLGEGTYNIEIFADGINADRDATDYTKTQRTAVSSDHLHVQLAPGGGWAAIATPTTHPSPDDRSQFVTLTDIVPDAILEIRYFGTYNFVGDRIDGYLEPTALLTCRAADSLRAVSDDLKRHGYRLKIYDAYRPQQGVNHFVRWAADIPDTLMKSYFYPDLDKSVLFDQEYIMARSGHTRGSTVDLTLFDMATEKELDMGGTFDWFGPESHPDFCGNPETLEYTGDNHKSPTGRSITSVQFYNRMVLRTAMLRHGFKPLDSEWWHFTLRDEPYPDTYFTFPVEKIK